MKILLQITATFFAGFLFHQLLPWWIIAVAAGVVAWFVPQKGFASFMGGFVAGALLWGSYSVWLNTGNEGLLAGKIGQLFGGLDATKLLLITGMMGGLLAGLGALTGSLGRKLGKE